MDIFTPNPLHCQLIPSWDSQAVDLVWKESGKPKVVGYHVWRAQGAPSNFEQITVTPLQTNFFRDITQVIQITEKPHQWVSPPDSSTGIIAIRATNTPLVKDVLDRANKPILASIHDVIVTYDDFPETPFQLQSVDPTSGLIVFKRAVVLSESMDLWVRVDEPNELPSLNLSYFSIKRFTDSTFGKDLFYKIVEVFEDGSQGSLELYPTVSNQDLDPADIWWREAMRRNRFIFEQVGEMAHVILRKTTGKLCPCVDPETIKARTECPTCWGVGYVGGYDGPYPITFTPPNATGQVKQGPDGRVKSRIAQSFIGPTPILNSGDILFRFNGERLVINDVERTSVRGTSLQQTYNTELLRPSDYRYGIQITNQNYPTLLISTNLPALANKDHSFGDFIPQNISLSEGISTDIISDPTLDVTKPESLHPEDMRKNTEPSNSPVFQNWSF